MTMVELKNIKFSYKRNKTLFNDLNLTLTPGFIYGLLGKNGAGKSTLLKQMAGLLHPDKGEVTIFGYRSTERIPEALQDIFIIPEEFSLPPVSINRYVQINAVFYPKFSIEQFDYYLKEFELEKDGKLSALSYGQKKKFLISFGLAVNARLLIFDEPSNGLDIPSKSQFRKLAAAALNEDKIFVISTHQVRDLENLIDTVVVIENGKIMFNENIGAISEKLSFEQNLNGVPENDILYMEEISGKKTGVVKNRTGRETRVDLELLFNGIVKNAHVFNNEFRNV